VCKVELKCGIVRTFPGKAISFVTQCVLMGVCVQMCEGNANITNENATTEVL